MSTTKHVGDNQIRLGSKAEQRVLVTLARVCPLALPFVGLDNGRIHIRCDRRKSLLSRSLSNQTPVDLIQRRERIGRKTPARLSFFLVKPLVMNRDLQENLENVVENGL